MAALPREASDDDLRIVSLRSLLGRSQINVPNSGESRIRSSLKGAGQLGGLNGVPRPLRLCQR